MAGKTATLPTIAVEPELREALDEIAAAQEVSLGHVIRQACKAYVEARTPSAPNRPGPETAARAHALNCKCGVCKTRKNGGQQ